jgi:poly-gamma-glutamate synthesis protein (capsule biosynthesis protein)
MTAPKAIGLLGDVMLGRGVAQELERGSELWDERLIAITSELDLVICNLECCVSARGAPTARVAGKPFFFRAPPRAVGALHAIGARAATLANNHALDFEQDALVDTVAALTDAGIASGGAGRDPEAARQPAVVGNVAVIAATDHPVEYAAGPSSWGVAFADLRDGVPGWLRDRIAACRRDGRLVIAFPHWGPNMTREPAGWQRAAALELQDAGADLVAGHSAHVFHGIGWTERGPIVYDLGDAIDDYAVDARARNDLGVLVIWRPGEAELELVGLRLDYAYTGLADEADSEWIARRLERACGKLGTSVTRTGEQRFVVTPD